MGLGKKNVMKDKPKLASSLPECTQSLICSLVQSLHVSLPHKNVMEHTMKPWVT